MLRGGRLRRRLLALSSRLIPVGLASALVATAAAGCSTSSADASRNFHLIPVAQGVSIRASGGSIKVTSSPEPQAAAWVEKPVQVSGQRLPSPLTVLATPRRITASGPLPSGVVILSFAVSKHLVQAGTVPFLASLDPSTGRWVAVPSSYDPATGVVSARVTHFSIWAPLGWVKSRIAALFQGALQSVFGLAGNGAPPACSGQLVTVTDTRNGGGVGACAELTGTDQVTAKVVNQRPYPIDLLYPVGAHVDVPSGDPFAQVGAAITNLVSNWHDRVLVPAGGEADSTLPLAAGHQTGFVTEEDAEAYLLGILGTAIRMLVQITGAPAEMIQQLLDELDGLSCMRDAADTASTLSLSLATAESIGSAAFDCLSQAAKGVSNVVFTVASIVASLAVELVAGIWGTVDNVIGDASHDLVVSRPADTLGSYLGEWHEHDFEVCIGSPLPAGWTGSTAPPCDGSSNSGWMMIWGCVASTSGGINDVCAQYYPEQFTSNADGSLTGTITGNVIWVDQNLNIVTPATILVQPEKPGDTITLKHADTGLLTDTSSDGTIAGYLCNNTVSAANQPKCGA